jgi:hypothetical protein
MARAARRGYFEDLKGSPSGFFALVVLSVQDSLYSGVRQSLRMIKGYVRPTSRGGHVRENNYAGAGSR